MNEREEGEEREERKEKEEREVSETVAETKRRNRPKRSNRATAAQIHSHNAQQKLTFGLDIARAAHPPLLERLLLRLRHRGSLGASSSKEHATESVTDGGSNSDSSSGGSHLYRTKRAGKEEEG